MIASRLYHFIPFILLCLSTLAVGLPALAQTDPLCPAQTLLSIARAGAACAMMERGEACYASGTVQSQQTAAANEVSLAQPGDRAPLRDLLSVMVQPANGDALSLATIIIRTSPAATDLAAAILINDVVLTNEVPTPIEINAAAIGRVPVRTMPDTESAVITELSINDGVTLNGRLQGGEWLRIIVPSTGAVGWAAASLLNPSSDVSALPTVTPSDQVAAPFQRFTAESGGTAACGGALAAGVLLQTPSTDPRDAVELTMNGLPFQVAGTLFIEADGGVLTVSALDGLAILEGTIIPAGAQVIMNGGTPGSVSGYDVTAFAVPPINNLPRRFQLAPSANAATIAAAIAALAPPTPTPIPATLAPDTTCRRALRRDTTVFAGPGSDFEALAELEAGTPITPVLAANAVIDGSTWWQLANSGWIAQNVVGERGDCSTQAVLLVARVPAPPTNRYSMERCASSNGAVRVGQVVTFEFIPPAWDNYGAARDAVRTDPGRFTFNNDRYRATASDPFPLGTVTDPFEDRYLRRFTFVWTAQPGTYRIIGDWLTYEPSCNLTVVVE